MDRRNNGRKPSASRKKTGAKPTASRKKAPSRQPLNRQPAQNAPAQGGKRAPVKRKAPPKKRPVPQRTLEEREKLFRKKQVALSQKKRRRKHRYNYTIYYIMLAVLLAGTGLVLSLTVFFRIESIQVTGSAFYGASEIQQMLNAKEGDNLLRYRASADESFLQQSLFRADRVQIKKKLPNKLLVEITDGVPVFQLYKAGQYYYVSGEGRFLYKGTDPLSGIPVILGAEGSWEVGKYLKDCVEQEKQDSIDRLYTLYQTVNDQLGNKITLINMASFVDVKLCYENRLQVNLGSFVDLAEKVQMLKETMESGGIGKDESGVIDLTQTNMLVFNSIGQMDETMSLASALSDEKTEGKDE